MARVTKHYFGDVNNRRAYSKSLLLSLVFFSFLFFFVVLDEKYLE